MTTGTVAVPFAGNGDLRRGQRHRPGRLVGAVLTPQGQRQGHRRDAGVRVREIRARRREVGVRPRVGAQRQRGRCEDVLADGVEGVDPSGAGVETGRVRDRHRAVRDGRLQPFAVPGGVLLLQDRGEAGDVRRGHRGATEGGVDVVDHGAELGAGGARGSHVDTGGDHLGLEGAVTQARSAAGEAGHDVVDVDRTHRQRRVGRPRRRDRGRARLAGVAGSDDEQGVGCRGQLVHGLRERVAAVVGVTTEAHADDVRALLHGPDHAGQDPGVLAVATVGEHLADHQVGARGDALALAVGRGPAAADRGCDVGAVAVAVGDGGVRREVRRLQDPVLQVRVRGVVARVEHGDGGARAGEAGRPRLRGVDLRHRVLQRRLDPAVEVDPGRAVGQGRSADRLRPRRW